MGYFDIYHELRNNDDLAKQLEKTAARLVSGHRGNNHEQVNQAVRDLFQQANYNSGVLLPFYFPNALAGDALDPMRRPFSYALFSSLPFLTLTVRGSRQTSKSTSMTARSLMLSDIIPGWRTLYVAPYDHHVKTYANKLLEMWRAFKYYFPNNTEYRQNHRYREWPNGSYMELIHILTDSAPARGKTADEIDYDEYQLFDPDLEVDVNQAQKSSKRPVTIYAGTSTTIDSPLELRYQQSSKAVWMVKCPGCNEWMNFGDEKRIVEMIKPSGLVCPICAAKKRRHLLDVTTGEFVHENRSQLEINNIGIHVPQLIIPEFTQDMDFWLPIYRDFIKIDRRKFMEELCAIPSEAGSREITRQDLMNICDRDATIASMKQDARAGRYIVLAAGADWGGSDDNPKLGLRKSLSYHSIFGLMGDGRIDLIYMRGYQGMDYAEIIHDMMRVNAEYGVAWFGTDAGVGLYYNNEIHKRMPAERHMVFAYSQPDQQYLRLPSTGGGTFNKMMLNRTESISHMFALIRSGPAKLRCYNWGEAGDDLLQFLNVYRVPTESGRTGGPRRFVYIRQGNKGDDAAHSANFGITTLKLANGDYVGCDEELIRQLNTRHQSSFGSRGSPYAGGYVSG